MDIDYPFEWGWNVLEGDSSILKKSGSLADITILKVEKNTQNWTKTLAFCTNMVYTVCDCGR
jgi:hypothetical protein